MPRALALPAVVPVVAAATALAACAGDEAVTPAAATTSARYVCTDGSAFDIRFIRETREVMTARRTVPTVRDSAVLLLDGAPPANLTARPVASGMHYAGDGYDFRGQGEEATLTAPDGTARTCRANS